MNLSPRQIIAIGAAVVFGPPTLIGFVVGYFVGWFGGIIAGAVAFVLVLIVAQAEITRRLKEQRELQSRVKEDDEAI